MHDRVPLFCILSVEATELCFQLYGSHEVLLPYGFVHLPEQVGGLTRLVE